MLSIDAFLLRKSYSVACTLGTCARFLQTLIIWTSSLVTNTKLTFLTIEYLHGSLVPSFTRVASLKTSYGGKMCTPFIYIFLTNCSIPLKLLHSKYGEPSLRRAVLTCMLMHPHHQSPWKVLSSLATVYCALQSLFIGVGQDRLSSSFAAQLSPNTFGRLFLCSPPYADAPPFAPMVIWLDLQLNYHHFPPRSC